MRHFAKIAALAAASMLFACAGSDETTGVESEHDDAVVEQSSDALKINPCALVRCRAGTQCEVQQGHALCVPVPPPAECASDKDCRLFSNYCDGCECLALSVSEPNPICKGDIVACFVDPCRGAEASCVAGQCVLGGAAASF
jgi:hypothetical protein